MSEWLIWCAPGGWQRRRRDGDAVADTTVGLDFGPETADAGPKATLLLPVERVLSLAIAVPARTRRQLIAAVPFAVEEHLACDLDEVHIATGAIEIGEPVAVRIVDRAFLDATLSEARASGVEVEQVYVDADRLPGDGAASAMLTADRALIRAGSTTIGVPREQFAGVAARVLRAARDGGAGSESERPRLTVFCPAGAPLGDDERATISGDGDIDERVVDPLAQLATGDTTIDLLQGAYARTPAGRFELRPWRAVAALLVAWFVVQTVADGARAFSLSRASDAATAQTETLYRTWFPDEQRLPDLRRQIVSRLDASSGGGSAGALDLIGALARAIGGDGGIELEGVTFAGERNELAVQLLAPEIGRLDALKEALGAERIVATVNSIEQDGGRVRARVRIERRIVNAVLRAWSTAIAPARAWFESLAERDRAIVIVLAGVIGATVVWLLVWQPVRDWRADAETRAASADRLLGLLTASEAQLRGRASRGGGDDRSLLSLVGSVAASENVVVTRFNPDARGGVSLVLQDAPFGNAMRMLDVLERQHRLRVRQMSINRREAGLVSATITLE